MRGEGSRRDSIKSQAIDQSNCSSRGELPKRSALSAEESGSCVPLLSTRLSPLSSLFPYRPFQSNQYQQDVLHRMYVTNWSYGDRRYIHRRLRRDLATSTLNLPCLTPFPNSSSSPQLPHPSQNRNPRLGLFRSNLYQDSSCHRLLLQTSQGSNPGFGVARWFEGEVF